MLALDSTIGCLEASEAEVLDLYRSAPISLCSFPGARAESTEAYLCAIKKKTLVKVYLAFVVNDQRIYVYTSPGKGKSEQEYPEQIEQALGQARAMGFSPDRIDLSYSPAMREVVVRNTKILRLPGTKANSGLKQGLPGAPVIPLLPQPATSPIPAEAATSTETGATKTESADLRRSLNELKKKHQALLTERDGLEHRLSQLAAKHEELGGELSCLKERCSGLCAENEALAASRTQVEALLPVRGRLDLGLPSHLGQPWLSGEAMESSSPAEREETAFPSFGDLGSSFVPLGEFQGDGAFGQDDAPVRFLLETSLNGIDCPAEEVLELYHSINNAYLSPEGNGGQESCQGYICCLGKGDRKKVFAAIYGMSSRRTWVYLPETQPPDEESYARTRRSAISFAEEVGLMMEEVPLEAAGPKRQERLGQCPTLRMTEKN